MDYSDLIFGKINFSDIELIKLYYTDSESGKIDNSDLEFEKNRLLRFRTRKN